MYRWWVFVHIVGVVGFLLAHGTSVAVTFHLRRERDPKKVGALIELSRTTTIALYGSTALLLVGGIVAAFIRDLWSRGWIWLSLVLLVLAGVSMGAMATPFYGRVAKAARIQASGGAPVPGQDLYVLLSSRRPLVIAGIGFVALIAIVYLMVLKPF